MVAMYCHIRSTVLVYICVLVCVCSSLSLSVCLCLSVLIYICVPVCSSLSVPASPFSSIFVSYSLYVVLCLPVCLCLSVLLYICFSVSICSSISFKSSLKTHFSALPSPRLKLIPGAWGGRWRGVGCVCGWGGGGELQRIRRLLGSAKCRKGSPSLAPHTPLASVLTLHGLPVWAHGILPDTDGSDC